MKLKSIIVLILYYCATLCAQEHIRLTQEEQLYLEKHPVINISNNLDFPLFDYAVDKKPLGYSVDLLELLLKKIGMKANFVNGASWSGLLKAFKEGKIDLLHATTKTRARKEFALFSNAYFKTRGCFFTHTSLQNMKSVNFLEHRTVAVVKDWKPGIYLKKHYPDINLLHVNTIDEMIEAVENNKAIAFFNECMPVFFHTRLWNIDSIKPNIILDEFYDDPDNSLYFATHQDAKPLISMLNKAYASLATQELNQLQKKWIQPSWQDDFEPLSFTKEEEVWLKNNSFIELAYVKHWDYSDDIMHHIERSYVELLSKYSGIDIWLTVFDSWQEAYTQTVQKDQIDGILYLTSKRDTKNKFNFLPPYSTMPLILQTNSRSKIQGLEDLKGSKIYTIEDSFSNEYIKNLPYNLETIALQNDKEIAQKISTTAPMIEAGLSYEIDTDAIRKKSIKVIKKIYAKNSNARLGILKEKQEVYSILKKAHEKIPKEELVRLQNMPYLYNNSVFLTGEEKAYLNNLGDIVICVTPNWLPFSDMREGKSFGMVQEYIEALELHTAKNFVLPNVNNWGEIIDKMKQKKCDIVSFIEETKSRRNYLNFTKSLVDVSYVVAGTGEKVFADDFNSIKEQVFAIEDKSGIYENMKLLYPNLRVIPVKNPREGLEKVMQKEAYGFIDTAFTIAYEKNKHKNMNTKIICKLPLEYNLAFGVNKEKPMLFEIVNKILKNINKKERKRIHDKWIALQHKEIIDYRLILEIVLVGVLILFFVILWNRKIAKANKLLEEAQEQIKLKNEALLRLATTDKLTGLFNRFKFDEIIKQEIEQYRRYETPLTLCMLDCDRFKRINDTFGHQIGDIVLQELSNVLKKNIRATDSIYRWGGEEFIILCPNTDMEGMEFLAQKLKNKITTFNFTKVGNCTASFGLTICQKNDTSSSLIKRVDEALYEAKETGRNKIIVK